MIAANSHILRFDAAGEEHDILALPSGVGDDQAIEIKKMGGLRNLLQAAIFFLLSCKSHRAVIADRHAQLFKRRHVRQPQGAAELNPKLIEGKNHA